MNVPLTPVRCLYRAVDLYGKKTGIVSGDSVFTYAQFGERCERLAAGLLSQGVRPGDRVAYLSFNNHQLLEGYYAPPLVRAIAMPLNVRLQCSELTADSQSSGASMLCFESEFASADRALAKSMSCASNAMWLSIKRSRKQICCWKIFWLEIVLHDRTFSPSTKMKSPRFSTPAAAQALRRG